MADSKYQVGGIYQLDGNVMAKIVEVNGKNLKVVYRNGTRGRFGQTPEVVAKSAFDGEFIRLAA